MDFCELNFDILHEEQEVESFLGQLLPSNLERFYTDKFSCHIDCSTLTRLRNNSNGNRTILQLVGTDLVTQCINEPRYFYLAMIGRNVQYIDAITGTLYNALTGCSVGGTPLRLEKAADDAIVPEHIPN